MIADDDYRITPCGHLGSSVSVGNGYQHLGVFSEMEDALHYIREDMEREQFYPSIWYISDHGNCWPIDIEGNEIQIDDTEENDEF